MATKLGARGWYECIERVLSEAAPTPSEQRYAVDVFVQEVTCGINELTKELAAIRTVLGRQNPSAPQIAADRIKALISMWSDKRKGWLKRRNWDQKRTVERVKHLEKLLKEQREEFIRERASVASEGSHVAPYEMPDDSDCPPELLAAHEFMEKRWGNLDWQDGYTLERVMTEFANAQHSEGAGGRTKQERSVMDNTQFYEVMPDGRYRFRVDHHTINDHNTCDRYFMFRHMGDSKGMVWSTKGTSIKIALGSWWSSVMESFYHEMQFGALPSDHMMIKFAAEAWREHNMEQYKNMDPEVFDKFGGLAGGQLMAMEYYEAFAKQHYTQWGIVGAELGFGWKDELPLGEDDKVVVYYGGKPDLVIWDKAQNMIMPLDFKTKDTVPANASLKYKPHPQTAGYIFAVREMLKQLTSEQTEINALMGPLPKAPTKCVIMVCARFRPTDKPRSGVRAPRFLPIYPNYDASEIEEWRLSVMEKCRRLRDSIERGVWTPRESACHLFYHGCAFRRVCAMPANVREMALQADFVKVEPWHPYTPEED